MNTVMQVERIVCTYRRRHLQGIVRIACFGVSNHDSRLEHLLSPVCFICVCIRVRGIRSKVISFPPHSTRTESHVNPFDMTVNSFGLIRACTMVQDLYFRGLSPEYLEVLDLCLEGVPYQEVLNSHNF